MGPTPSPNPRDHGAFRRALLAWFDRARRDLPWRRTRDPYLIWLSEILLQQTRVEAVKPYYERFVAAFPTVQALAAAPLDDVLRLWAGLGYYSRARNLHCAAQTVIADFRGQMPATSEQLQTLPGVGRYTAAAVASIAFGEPVAVLDGNVKRVLARILEIADPIDTPDTTARLWSAAEELLAPRRAGDFNQAMMELGAVTCTPRNPRCESCPVRRHCAAATSGRQFELPRKSEKRAVPRVYAVAGAIWRNGRLLVVQRRPAGLLGGLWELPGGEFEWAEPPKTEDHVGESSHDPMATALERILLADFGIQARVAAPLGEVAHEFTHRSWRTSIFACELQLASVELKRHTAAKWASPSGLEGLAWAMMDRKILSVSLDTAANGPALRRGREMREK